MTARISLILGKTRGHRPRLQLLFHEFCNSLDSGGEWAELSWTAVPACQEVVIFRHIYTSTTTSKAG